MPTARSLLESAVDAYKKAASYTDAGKIRVQASLGNQKVDDAVDYSLTLVRPNKLRLHVYQVEINCDGRQFHAFTKNTPGQVLRMESPNELTLQSILVDPVLTNSLVQGPMHSVSWVPMQLLLLLGDDPLKTILHEAAEPVMLEPDKIGPNECHRVEIPKAGGPLVLWIDRQSQVLRRMELPPDEQLGQSIFRGRKADEIKLTVEFEAAELGGQIDGTAFRFEAGAEDELVDSFAPAPMRLLGKPVGDFKFVDLENKPIARETFAGKIVVLDFWATWCQPCQLSLPGLQQVYKKYKDNQRLAFLAVSADRPDTDSQQLREVFKKLAVEVPIARDPEQCLGKVFKTMGIPSVFIIGAKGVVQDFESGYNPELPGEMSAKLDKLLTGKDVYPERLELLQAERKRYSEWLDEWVSGGLLLSPEAAAQEIPRAEIGKRTEPATLKLTSIWKYTEGKQLGVILAVPNKDGPPRLLAVDNWTTVAEVGHDGKLVARHELDIPKEVPIGWLRTAVGADGKRYIVGWAPGMQQLHLFDESFKRLLSYPADALEYRHAGLTDVHLADLEGDGTLKLYVAYGGDAGVQAVSLEGKRLWSFRAVGAVPRMAVVGPDKEGHRSLLCADRRGQLRAVDSQGKEQGSISLADRPLRWITSADLDGDGQPELCGLSSVELGVDVAVGFALPGSELWSYELPKGVQHNSLVEPVSKVNLSGKGPAQWILAGPDGSIHIIAADGKLVDRFNYGATLRGLATAGWDNRNLLLVSSPDGLEAFDVQWPAAK